MFLSSPGISELKMLDLSLLLEMLVQQTTDYINLIKDEGFTERTEAAKDLLENIQTAIATKQRFSSSPITDHNVIPSSAPGVPLGIPRNR